MNKKELEVIYLISKLKNSQLELLKFYIEYELKCRKTRSDCKCGKA